MYSSFILHNWWSAQLRSLGTADIHYFNYLEEWLKIEKMFKQGGGRMSGVTCLIFLKCCHEKLNTNYMALLILNILPWI